MIHLWSAISTHVSIHICYLEAQLWYDECRPFHHIYLPITKRAKLGVSSFSHSPFTPLFGGCDGSMMEIFAEDKKGGLKDDNE
jgi:hypothetical protein